MSELDDPVQQRLRRAYEAKGPTSADRERMLAALETTIAAGGVAGTLTAGAKGGLKAALLSHPIAASVVGLGAGCVVALSIWWTRPEPKSASAPAPASSGAVALVAPLRSASEPLPSPAPAELDSDDAPPTAIPERRRAAPRNDDLAAEAALLQRAHAAYRSGQPGETLRLLQQHGAKYPRSQLGVERSTLKVLALCALNRTDEARRTAATFPSLPTALHGSCAER
jgi:hypothetical protein